MSRRRKPKVPLEAVEVAAASLLTRAELAVQLEMTLDELAAEFERSPELARAWASQRVSVRGRIHLGVLAAAEDGSAAAAKMAIELLERDSPPPVAVRPPVPAEEASTPRSDDPLADGIRGLVG